MRRPFARVLDIDEQCLAVWGFAQAGDFAINRTDEKALERVRCGGFADISVDCQSLRPGARITQAELAAVADSARQGRAASIMQLVTSV